MTKSYSAQLVTMQTNEEENAVVTGIMHSSRLGIFDGKKVVIHKMNNITDEILSWVQENVRFCNSCPCTITDAWNSHDSANLTCQPHFVKKFPQDIDEHCPEMLTDDIIEGIRLINMKHQDVATFTIDSIYPYKSLREVDFSFNNLTELKKIEYEHEMYVSLGDLSMEFNFSHNQIEKISDGLFDNFMGNDYFSNVKVDLSSNPKSTILTQSPIIHHWMDGFGYNGHLGNFTTYFGNEYEVRTILDKICRHPAITSFTCNDCCHEQKEDNVLICDDWLGHYLKVDAGTWPTITAITTESYGISWIYQRCWFAKKFKVSC